MDFLKRHYEKLILTVVLAGLLGAAGWLLWQVRQVGQEVENQVAPPNNKAEVEDPDKYKEIVATLRNPVALDLDKPHHVFNSWTWFLRTNDQQFIRGSQIGPGKLQVNKHNSLHLMVDAKASISSDRTNFTLHFTREYHTNSSLRTALTRSTAVGGTVKADDAGVLRGVLKEARWLGTLTNEFVVDILLTNEPPVTNFTISPGNLYKRVMGYSLDLGYPPEPVPPIPTNRRLGDIITFGGESYKIIAIKETEFTVESVSTEKRTTIPIRPRQ